jgi:hypothetical protein
MSIIVTHPGKLPENDPFRGTCSRCKAHVECLRSDTKPRDGGRNETDFYVPCPTPGCGSEILVFEKR